MENNQKTAERILESLGVNSLVKAICVAFKHIDDKTNTEVISDEVLKAIQNPEKAKNLRKAVDKYHETGQWNEKELQKIL